MRRTNRELVFSKETATQKSCFYKEMTGLLAFLTAFKNTLTNEKIVRIRKDWGIYDLLLC